MNDSKDNEYNQIPVVFCKDCLSLDIGGLDIGVDYCNKCGSTTIEEMDIFKWRQLYRNAYGRDFLESSNVKNKMIWKK